MATRSKWARVTTAVAVTVLGFVAAMATAQTVQTQRVMQQKLAESQRILGAVVTSNWAELGQRARALQSLTQQPGWQVLQTPEFRNYTANFQKAAQAVADASNQRDQQTAVAAYNGLVTSCVDCHRYVARSRIALAPIPEHPRRF